jgi:ppGpp synthetase/RelA/SpoT-type nucleotidyltranferase
MNTIIKAILDEHMYSVKDGPTAIVWDSEYAKLYDEFGIKPETRDSMYTSVHYVVQPSQRTALRLEIQVRTLMEEVWGEVSHKVNYPDASLSRACTDQLKVLARMTSGCTRLVDSIFKSHSEVGAVKAVKASST